MQALYLMWVCSLILQNNSFIVWLKFAISLKTLLCLYYRGNITSNFLLILKYSGSMYQVSNGRHENFAKLTVISRVLFFFILGYPVSCIGHWSGILYSILELPHCQLTKPFQFQSFICLILQISKRTYQS